MVDREEGFCELELEAEEERPVVIAIDRVPVPVPDPLPRCPPTSGDAVYGWTTASIDSSTVVVGECYSKGYGLGNEKMR